MKQNEIVRILEAILMSAEKPMTLNSLMKFFSLEELVTKNAVRDALAEMAGRCDGRGFELRQVASGYRYQTRPEYRDWVSKHWDEKPPRYSRALMEILALIIYRQPTTRAEIEEIRGVAVSSNIIKTLEEREWIRVVGHKEVPGRPAMFGTTPQLLDYFNLSSLDELPALSELKNLDEIYPELAAKADKPENDESDASTGSDDSSRIDASDNV
ncbi:SMC-Scp complex subunit ScpB [Leucothrix pacifica]|uniref:SMC-Scp complex subunit ScpB n=1 Tax=Leucothrix pacifica TaxID=1247513 RepID=A0A317C9I2_9GAMM|nr:SMC-Scp complex subunit ScpB [Leucothrix pacifica]PWQ95029.1 SMC-Scp complex subunit ScpB [Leucothrix pacifica]